MEPERFIVVTDFPTIPDPEGELDSHGCIRQVRVCDCPKVVLQCATREDAEGAAAEINHSVVLPVRRA